MFYSIQMENLQTLMLDLALLTFIITFSFALQGFYVLRVTLHLSACFVNMLTRHVLWTCRQVTVVVMSTPLALLAFLIPSHPFLVRVLLSWSLEMGWWQEQIEFHPSLDLMKGFGDEMIVTKIFIDPSNRGLDTRILALQVSYYEVYGK